MSFGCGLETKALERFTPTHASTAKKPQLAASVVTNVESASKLIIASSCNSIMRTQSSDDRLTNDTPPKNLNTVSSRTSLHAPTNSSYTPGNSNALARRGGGGDGVGVVCGVPTKGVATTFAGSDESQGPVGVHVRRFFCAAADSNASSTRSVSASMRVRECTRDLFRYG